MYRLVEISAFSLIHPHVARYDKRLLLFNEILAVAVTAEATELRAILGSLLVAEHGSLYEEPLLEARDGSL